MENYEILRELGVGAQGLACLVHHKETDENYVLKKIECEDESEANCAFQEALIFKQKVSHDGVGDSVSVFVHWDRELSSMFLCIISEYYPAGNLMTQMEIHRSKNKIIEESTIKKWLAELIGVLTLVHSNGFFHCDLMPTNVFLKSDNSLVVTDFAMPTVASDVKHRTRAAVGLVDYAAPEVQVQQYDSRTDVWSLGCIFLQLITCTLYDKKQLTDQLTEIKHNSQALQELLGRTKKFYSVGLTDAIKSMLNIKHSQRPTVFDLSENPFVKNCLANLEAEQESKISGHCKPFADGESTLVYLKYVVDNIESKVCTLRIFEHLWKLAESSQRQRQHEVPTLTLDTSKTQIIIQAMKQHRRSKDITLLGLKILGSQITNATYSSEDCFIHVDSVAVVCDVMKDHPKDSDIQQQSIFLLMASSICEAAVDYIYSLKGVSLILAAMRSFLDDVHLCTSCLSALLSLISHDGNMRVMEEEKGVTDVANTINRHLQSQELFEAGSALTIGLALQDKNLAAINRLDLTSLILSGMILHQENARVVRFGCCALTAIVESDEESAYKTMSHVYNGQKLEGIVRLMEIYDLHKENPDVVSGFLNLFLELAQYEDIASEMKYLKIGDVVANCRKLYCDNLNILSICDKVKTKTERVGRQLKKA